MRRRRLRLLAVLQSISASAVLDSLSVVVQVRLSGSSGTCIYLRKSAGSYQSDINLQQGVLFVCHHDFQKLKGKELRVAIQGSEVQLPQISVCSKLELVSYSVHSPSRSTCIHIELRLKYLYEYVVISRRLSFTRNPLSGEILWPAHCDTCWYQLAYISLDMLKLNFR